MWKNRSKPWGAREWHVEKNVEKGECVHRAWEFFFSPQPVFNFSTKNVGV